MLGARKFPDIEALVFANIAVEHKGYMMAGPFAQEALGIAVHIGLSQWGFAYTMDIGRSRSLPQQGLFDKQLGCKVLPVHHFDTLPPYLPHKLSFPPWIVAQYSFVGKVFDRPLDNSLAGGFAAVPVEAFAGIFVARGPAAQKFDRAYIAL